MVDLDMPLESWFDDPEMQERMRQRVLALVPWLEQETALDPSPDAEMVTHLALLVTAEGSQTRLPSALQAAMSHVARAYARAMVVGGQKAQEGEGVNAATDAEDLH